MNAILATKRRIYVLFYVPAPDGKTTDTARVLGIFTSAPQADAAAIAVRASDGHTAADESVFSEGLVLDEIQWLDGFSTV